MREDKPPHSPPLNAAAGSPPRIRHLHHAAICLHRESDQREKLALQCRKEEEEEFAVRRLECHNAACAEGRS